LEKFDDRHPSIQWSRKRQHSYTAGNRPETTPATLDCESDTLPLHNREGEMRYWPLSRNTYILAKLYL